MCPIQGPNSFSRCKGGSNQLKRIEHAKIRKNSGTAHTLTKLGAISIGENSICTYFKAVQHNSELKQEALTSVGKDKQIRTGGKVQGSTTVNLNSTTLKSAILKPTVETEQKEQISRWNWPDPLKLTKTVKERREGAKDEELLLLATPYGDLGAEHQTQRGGQ